MTRRGVTILEAIVAAGMLVGVMAICLQMLGAVAAQRRAAEIRQTAIRETANVMERLGSTPWDELTEQSVQGIHLSKEAGQGLPEGELKIDLTNPTDEPDAKRIAVSLRWKDRTGRFVLPVRLVAWRYRR